MKRKGFTLIEIIVVLSILGVLTGFGGVKYVQHIKDADILEGKVNCSLLEGAIVQAQIEGKTPIGEEVQKSGVVTYVDKEGVKEGEVLERQYRVNVNAINSKVDTSKIKSIEKYLVGESGVVRYYGKLSGKVKEEIVAPKLGDVIVQGDYEYKYKSQYSGTLWVTSTLPDTHWGVRVLDKSKTTYADIPDTLNGYPVTSLTATFANCSNMTTVPKISSNAVLIMNMLKGCTALEDGTFTYPEGVTQFTGLYSGCTKLKKGIDIPTNAIIIADMYRDCVNVGGELNVNLSKMLEIADYANVFSGAVQTPNTLVIKGMATDEIKEMLVSTQTTGNIRVGYPEPTNGMTVEKGDYRYVYGGTGWNVEVIDKTRTAYGLIESTLKGKSVISMVNTFKGCTELTTAPSIPTGVTLLYGTFSGCTSLTKSVDIPTTVTNMTGTFDGCSSLLTAPIIPQGVREISTAFRGCSKLRDAPTLPNSVTKMEETFKGCATLTTSPIIPTNVTSLAWTFEGCKSMKTAPTIPMGVLNMNGTFANCSALESMTPIPSSVLTMANVFIGCSNLQGELILNANPTTYDGCFSIMAVANPNKLVIKGSATDTTKENIAKTSNSGNVTVWYDELKNGEKVVIGDYTYTYMSTANWSVRVNDKTKTTYGIIESTVKGKPVTHMLGTFKGCTNLTFAPEIPAGVTSMSAAFDGCTNLTAVPTLPSGVIDMPRTFYNCAKLKTAPAIPLGVINMSRTFSGCTTLTEAPIIPDSVLDMTLTFFGCTNLTTAPVIRGKVTTMSGAFSGCKNLKTAPILPVSVTDLATTFAGCTSLTTAPTIPVGVTSMSATFQECSSLVTAPIIPNSVLSMNGAFRGCRSLIKAPVLSSNVTDITGIFEDCTKLTTPPEIPKQVIYMGSAFKNCDSLTTAPTIPAGVLDMALTFKNCSSLGGEIIVNANPSEYTGCFTRLVSILTNKIVIKGSATLATKTNLKNTGGETVIVG